MKKQINRWGLLIGVLLVGVPLAGVFAANNFQRETVNGNQIYDLMDDGSIVHTGPNKQGNNNVGASLTLPTTTTGSQFSSAWIPVFNVSAVSIPQGTVLVASNTGTGFITAGLATSGITSVVGVAAETIAASSNGWMSPRGGAYAVVLATGTVAIGDILVSTVQAAGYLATNNTPTAGTEVATAMSKNTTGSGGSVLAIMW